MQFLNELLERQILVSVCAQGGFTDLIKDFSKAHFARQMGSESQGIYKQPDQGFGFDLVTSSNRGADNLILLLSVAIEQGFEGGQQHHE